MQCQALARLLPCGILRLALPNQARGGPRGANSPCGPLRAEIPRFLTCLAGAAYTPRLSILNREAFRRRL